MRQQKESYLLPSSEFTDFANYKATDLCTILLMGPWEMWATSRESLPFLSHCCEAAPEIQLESLGNAVSSPSGVAANEFGLYSEHRKQLRVFQQRTQCTANC